TAHDVAVFQRQTVLPLAGQLLTGAGRDYNAMQIGVFGYLDAKREQLRAGRTYVLALRDYWLARTRFEQIVWGGSPADAGPAFGAANAGAPEREVH
ncbi:MAG: TolC family protein, partial [Alphaproteobacteria bacterium]|nr:TolC family protein [Alphaproteobacteria bacterium]